MDAAHHGVPDDIAGVEAWRRDLVAFAAGQLKPHAEMAEDIVQDAYEHLMRRAIADAPPHHARAWLYAVVRSRCRDERTRRTHIPLDVVADDLATPNARPEETVIAAAASRWMVEQVDALPTAERTALIGSLIGEPSGADARSANAHYQALLRARRRLRRAYEGAWAGVLAPFVPIGRGLRRAAAFRHTVAAAAKTAPVGVRLAVAAGAAATVVSAPVVVPAVARITAGAAPRTEVARIPGDVPQPLRRRDGLTRDAVRRAIIVSGASARRSLPVAAHAPIPVAVGDSSPTAPGGGVPDSRPQASDAGSATGVDHSGAATANPPSGETQTETAPSPVPPITAASPDGTENSGTSPDAVTSATDTTTGS